MVFVCVPNGNDCKPARSPLVVCRLREVRTVDEIAREHAKCSISFWALRHWILSPCHSLRRFGEFYPSELLILLAFKRTLKELIFLRFFLYVLEFPDYVTISLRYATDCDLILRFSCV